MKGDFTRDTFNKENHFSRVLMQQGRVTLDADFNEQTAILLHYLRTLARDLIGPHGAPKGEKGFLLNYDKAKGLVITQGHYYVDGILVENEDENCSYLNQPNPPRKDDELGLWFDKPNTDGFWIYLDVWERHITVIEDDSIREKALSGPDTCARAKVVWQVSALSRNDIIEMLSRDDGQKLSCSDLLNLLNSKSESGLLGIKLKEDEKKSTACVISPDSKYQGLENQLYRVEVHKGGSLGAATFKWSRDNGSVVTHWLNTIGNDIAVSNSRGFNAGNWVELINDTQELQGDLGIFVKLANVEGNRLTVDAASTPPAWNSQLVNPKVRRWDQMQNGEIMLTDGALPTNKDPNTWFDLEDGIQVQFSQGKYRTGDYWMIPARVSNGSIEWPTDKNGAYQPMPPNGIEHHYAPLGFITADGPTIKLEPDCRCELSLTRDCGQ